MLSRITLCDIDNRNSFENECTIFSVILCSKLLFI